MPTRPEAPARRARGVLELLPLDEERRIELEVYLALGNAALTDAELRPTLDRVVAAMRTWCGRSSGCSACRRDDREYEACRLHALLDGLAMQVVRLAPGESGDWAIDVLDRHLDGVTAG